MQVAFFNRTIMFIFLGASIHLTWANGVSEYWASLTSSDLQRVCYFEHDGSDFSVLRSPTSIITAERVAAVSDSRALDEFAVGWKLFGGNSKPLYLEGPPESLSHEVVNDSGKHYVQHVSKHTPLKSYRGRIRVELRFADSSMGMDYAEMPVVGACELTW